MSQHKPERGYLSSYLLADSSNSGAKKRVGRLFRRLSNQTELEKAWLEVLAHYEKAKVPPELKAFERRRGHELSRLAGELRDRTFLPEPAALIYIPKPGKPCEQRPITLVKPDDRIVLTLLNRLLDPLFEHQFLPHSHAYRKGHGALRAVERVEKCLKQGLEHTASGDIDDFFGSIDRGRLMNTVSRTIWERPILDLVETYLHMGATRHLEWVESDRGIAQGSPLSPLLSNVYLLEFDRFLEGLGVEWVRYADNFILLAREPEAARQAFARAETYLNQHYELRLNPGSRQFASSTDGFEFLGFRFHQGRRTMTPAKLEQKRLALAEHLRSNPNNLPALVEAVCESVRGWRAYYGSSPDTREQFRLLEQHLFNLLVPWVERYRTSGAGKNISAIELKAALTELELPAETDPRKKLKWVELVLARSRPQAAQVSTVARRAVEKRKREYRKKKQELQEILVTRPGTYLGRTGERLLVRRQGKRESEVPLSVIHSITLLTTAASLSAELMSEAAGRGISIHILGADGKPAVRIGPPEPPSYHLSLAQARLAGTREGLDLARAIVCGKVTNQINLLRYYAKYPERRGGGKYLPETVAAIAEMEGIERGVAQRSFGDDIELERGRLFAAEGQAASTYWKVVKSLLWQKTGFESRVRKGAGDLVNSLLNYGYGILYSRLLAVLVRAGLNITIGFLHKPQPGKPALLYDFIEEFRTAAVDRVVFSTLNLGKSYQVTDQGLAPETKHDLSRHVIRRLQAPTRYHGESIPLEKVMDHQVRLLVRHIEGKDRYRSFVLPW
jgi:CRISPR-associated endonuclease Cas1/group II intron reverse transcriptase/maturase